MGVLNVCILQFLVVIVSCKEYMPVLLWSNHSTMPFSSEVAAFTKMSSNDFTDYLLKRVNSDKPMILVFLEENLSVEDFSWRDINGEGSFPTLKHITKLIDDVEYLPSVQNPGKGLKTLKHHGYSWKKYDNDDFASLPENENTIFEVELNEPETLEDRPDLLRRHDKQIASVYKEAAEHRPNVLAVYSGNHNSWIDNEIKRYKREERDVNATDSNDLIIFDDKNVVRMSLTLPIVYQGNDPKEILNITKKVGTPTIDIEKEKISMTVKFSLNDKVISVKFEFSSVDQDWWTLDSAEILEFKIKNLIPSIPVGAPAQYSYFCNPEVVFSNGSISLTFKNFQVQPRVGRGNSFGPVMHCIPYFSIAIWSGLVIVLILSVVLTWGIVMIMDINTNDRFDDPKGKTITITATD